MKITAMVAMLITGAAAYGQTVATERKVAICVNNEAGVMLHPSKTLASKMFSEIGVTVVWHTGFHNCPADAILISLGVNTPASLKPGALAFARPYEGSHIQVFYDRISNFREPGVIPTLLAHVLVHEITHILQCVARHSETGIMKANWDDQDLFQMRLKALAFAPEDIGFIYKGLAVRAHSAMVAMNAGNRMFARR